MFVHNEPETIRIRRCRSTLQNIGTGILFFSAWSTVKAFLLLTLALPYSLFEAYKVDLDKAFAENPFLQELLSSLVPLVTILFLLMGILLRFYVGMCARAEADGKRCKSIYIVIAFLMAVLGLFAMGMSIKNVIDDVYSNLQNLSLTGMIIEATSVILLLDLVVNAIRIRRLTCRTGR